jgi:rare lipoprotein A
MSIYFYGFSLLLLLLFSSCAIKNNNLDTNLTHPPAKHQVYEGHYKVGKPYSINDVTYTPYAKVSKNHIEHGKASWYGKGDHNKKTANGDTFNKYMLTAAHPRLPLPSMIKVTNLANNKELIVMVNDRGPFRHNRILDLSETAAEILGFKNSGVTNVKVQYLHEETSQLLAKLALKRKHGSRASTKMNLAAHCSADCYVKAVNVKHNLYFH